MHHVQILSQLYCMFIDCTWYTKPYVIQIKHWNKLLHKKLAINKTNRKLVLASRFNSKPLTGCMIKSITGYVFLLYFPFLYYIVCHYTLLDAFVISDFAVWSIHIQLHFTVLTSTFRLFLATTPICYHNHQWGTLTSLSFDYWQTYPTMGSLKSESSLP